MEEEGGGMSLCGNCIEENGEGKYLKTCGRTPLFPLIKHDIQNTEDTLVGGSNYYRHESRVCLFDGFRNFFFSR